MSAKKIIMLCSVLVLAILSFFFIKNVMVTDEVFVPADGPHITNLAELEAYADLIIVGEPVRDFWDREHVTKKFPDGGVMDAYTLTDIRVDGVLKKPADFSLVNNGTITVVEPIGVVDGTLGKRKYIIENSYKVKQGKKYIFFLVNNSFGDYTIGNGVLGRFNLDGTDGDDVDKIKADKDVKLKLLNEIRQAYGQKLE